jgi:hypothetical protein
MINAAKTRGEQKARIGQKSMFASAVVNGE